MNPTTALQRALNLARVATFVYLTSTIVVMASERVFWYWAGFTVDSVFMLGTFYLIPTAAALWALAHARATRWYQVILAGAFFGFVVEGVLTPMLYLDGPLPIMAAMFVGWHGTLAFFGFWYLARRWLLTRRRTLVAAASAGVGVMWGWWAIAASVQEPAEEISRHGGNPELLAPESFALYAFGVGLTLAAAHWVIGYVWPRLWRPGRMSTIAVAVVSLAYMAPAVIVAVPWAPLKLAALLGGTYWLMIRRRGARNEEPTILDLLAGKVRLRDTLALLAMPATAAITYAMLWAVDLSPGALGAAYWAMVALQVVGGAAAYLAAARMAVAGTSAGAPTPIPT